MRVSRGFLALSCVAVLTLAACGGTDDDGGSGGSSSSRSSVRSARSSSVRSRSSSSRSARSSSARSTSSVSSKSVSSKKGSSSSRSARSSVSSRKPFSLSGSSASSSSDAVAVVPAGAIKLHIDADRSEAQPSDQVYYTVSIRNTAAQTLDSFQVVFSYAAPQLTIVESDGVSGEGHIQWTIDALQPNQKRALRVHASVAAGLQHGEVVRTNAVALRQGTVEPEPAAHEIHVIESLPATGEGDGVAPLENTRRFLRPFSSGSLPALPAIVWTATILMGVGIGVQAGKRYL